MLKLSQTTHLAQLNNVRERNYSLSDLPPLNVIVDHNVSTDTFLVISVGGNHSKEVTVEFNAQWWEEEKCGTLEKAFSKQRKKQTQRLWESNELDVCKHGKGQKEHILWSLQDKGGGFTTYGMGTTVNS